MENFHFRKKMQRIKLTLTLLFFTLGSIIIASPKYEVIKLWDNPQTKKEVRPELRIFRPQSNIKKSKTCILICPGGSYHHLGLTNEGSEVAEYFNQWGVTAIVLRYRVSMRGNHHPAMIEDFQRAMQIIHLNAEKWGIENIGAIGFSAGGHLVTMGGAFYKDNYLQKKGIEVDNEILRPEFVCPIYPVVSMQDSIAHQKSRVDLLTKEYTKADLNHFSMEQQIPNDMPPVFLLACKDDDVVDYRNSEVLHKALERNGIPCEYHLMNEGGHGFGMIRTKSKETKNWGIILKNWLIKNNFLKY